MTITLSEANRAIATALAKADDFCIRISVSVCDPQGRLIAHQRMDGVFAEASRGSIGKAIAAAETGRPSGAESFEPEIPARTATVTGAGAPVIRVRGGLPIIRNGAVEGAIGVSGAPGDDQDEECTLAALVAVREST
jgi:uncharacterized protein GlcG (DUF336 family)